jgi:DNA-binding transcriptional LysR family regulator
MIICQNYLPALIIAFKKEYPNAKFQVTMMPSSSVVTLMNNKKCHFGFLRNDFGWERDESRLLSVNYIAAVSRQKFKLADLANMNRIAYTTDTYYQKMLELWWKNNFDTLPKIDVMVNDLNLCKKMVFSGLGFGLLPSIVLPECPQAHSLILKDRNGKPIERKTYMIYKKDVINSKLTRNFLKFVQEHEFSSFLQLSN